MDVNVAQDNCGQINFTSVTLRNLSFSALKLKKDPFFFLVLNPLNDTTENVTIDYVIKIYRQ